MYTLDLFLSIQLNQARMHANMRQQRLRVQHPLPPSSPVLSNTLSSLGGEEGGGRGEEVGGRGEGGAGDKDQPHFQGRGGGGGKSDHLRAHNSKRGYEEEDTGEGVCRGGGRERF